MTHTVDRDSPRWARQLASALASIDAEDYGAARAAIVLATVDVNALLAALPPTPEPAAPGLREALIAIRDMEPERVDETVPSHAKCAECKRWEGHPIQRGMCDALYRQLDIRDRRLEGARQQQQWRMRDIARAALDETPGEPR